MASLRHDEIADVVQSTQHRFREPQWVDISLPFQKYYFARLLKGRGGDMKKRPEIGGDLLEWKLRVRNQGSGRVTGLYNQDVLNKINVLDNAQITWSYQDAHYILDTREPKWQPPAVRIINLTELSEQGLYNDFFELMEPLMWAAPSSSSLSPMPPAGIPFWLQKSSTAAFGFNGLNPSGWSSGAGTLSTTTYENWRNGTFTWATVSPEDFVEKLVQAMDHCEFEAPQPFPNLVNEKPDWGFYTVYYNIQRLRRILQAGAQSLNDDVALHMGVPYARGTAFHWVPALDNANSDAIDTSRPIFGVNWQTFEYFFKEGEAMIRHPMQATNSHRVLKRYLDNSGNIVCYDRRRNFCAYDSTA